MKHKSSERKDNHNQTPDEDDEKAL